MKKLIGGIFLGFFAVIFGMSVEIVDCHAGLIDNVSLQAYAPPPLDDPHPVALGIETTVFSDGPVEWDGFLLETDFSLGDVNYADLRFFQMELYGVFDVPFNCYARIDGIYTFDEIDYSFYADKTIELTWSNLGSTSLAHGISTGLFPNNPFLESQPSPIKDLTFTLSTIEVNSPVPTEPVPEPATMFLFGIGIAILIPETIIRKKKNTNQRIGS